jgi:hypothetical protein
MAILPGKHREHARPETYTLCGIRQSPQVCSLQSYVNNWPRSSTIADIIDCWKENRNGPHMYDTA